MASTFRDLLRQRLATMPGLGTGGPVATSAETRTGIPGGAAQARALAAPNQADPMGLSNQDPAFRAAQEAWALWQRKRASSAAAGGGVPQSAQSYDQLVSRGPGYGSQAARVANAQPIAAPQAPVVPQVQDIRKFEMNTQLPSGTAAPPELPPVSDAEWEAARQEQIRAFSYLTAAPNDPQAQAAYDAAVARVQDLSLRRNGPNYFTGKSAMDLLDVPRDLIVTEMGANAYDVATGKKQDWGAEWAAVAPGNWMIPGIDQTRFTQDFEAWVENPANWQAIRFAAENGFQADENSPRFTGGRAVWELFINSAGTAYKVAADILLDPSILAAPAQQVGKGFTRIGAAATADARPMAATIYRGAGRALSLPQDVLDRSVDAPFNVIGDAIGGTIRYVDGKLRPGKSGILDESLYDQGVEAANTLDRSITAYEGTRPIDPDVPDAGPMPPPDGPSSPSGMPRYTMAVENGENVIRDPQGEVVERLPYQAQTGLEPPRVNRDAQRTLDRYNFDIDTAEYTQAGAVLPDRNLGWADPRYNATTRQGRDRPMTITDRAAYDATIPAEQRQAFWTEVTPQIEEHVRVMDDIRAREMSADFGRGVSYERDFVQGGTQRHTPEKAFEEVRHVAEDLIPAWRKHIQGQDVPPYQRRYTDRTSDAALIETAVFGSRDEAIAARKQLRINGTRIEGFRDGKDFVDRLAMMAKDVNGEGFLSTDPTAVRSRAYREAMRTQNPDPAAIQEVAPQVNRRVVGQTPGGNNIEQSFDPTDTTGFKSIFQSQDELIGGQYIVRQDGLGGPWQVLRSGDNTVLASFPTEEAIIIDGVAYQPGKIAARAEADRLIAALPDAVERSIDQATISAPDMAPPVLPEPKTTPQGRKKPEHMPWDDTLDDDMALRMANAKVNWRTPTGNAVKGGQARSVYVIPRGSGTRGMDRVKIQWVQRRDGDMWQVFRGEVPDKNTVELATLQDAIALADEMANLIKKGMVNPDKKTLGIINRPPNEEAAMAALRDDYGMIEGLGDTAARSAADQSHVGLAHQIGKLTTEDYDYLSQVVTYNDRPMRLWEAYEMALYDFRDDKLKAKQALVDQLMSPEVKAVMDERRMTAAERKAFNATKSKARRALDAALRPYDAWTNFYRQRIMFNWARGTAGVLADQIERTYSLSLNREYRAALTAWDPRTIKRFLADERGKEKVLDAMESVARYRKVHGKNPPADWLQMVETRFMEGGNKNVAGEGLGWVYNKTPLRATADPFIRDLRVSMDRHARYQLGMAAWDRNLADGHLRMRGLVRTQAEKNGLNGDEAVRAFDAFAKEEGGYYSGDMVYQWARDFGMVDGRAKRLGRDWAEISNGASRAADERVRKLLFSYKMTNADNILRRGMLFHYWISRAAVLHARTTLQNPWLLNAYANAWNAMEKEAEANGYPPNIIGFTKLMQSELGMYALVSPANLLVPFFFLMEGAASENQDPGVLGFIRRWGGFINPQIEAAAAILGFHNRVPDLTGTTAVRRALRVTINWLNNNGYAGLVPDAMGEEGTWQESWLDQYMVWGVGKANAFMRAVTGGEDSPLNEFVTYDTGGYEQDQMQTILLDFAEAEFGGTADTWTDAQWDKYFVAQTAIMTGSKGNDLSDQTIDAYSDERLLGIGLTTVMPGGVVQRYAPRDQDLIGNREGDPNASLRRDLATAGSPQDAELTALHERFKNLGDERETALWDGYWSIVNPDNVGDGDVLVIGNERYFGHQIKRMSEPEREALAKRWLNSYDGQAEFDAYGEKRKTFLAEHPEYGDFKEYQKGVYGYDGGVRKWRERQAIKDKQFAAEQESVRARYASQGKSGEVLEAELDGWAGSIAGYKAASGYRDSSYDPPMDETVQDFGFTADTGGGKTSAPSAPKSTPQKIGDTITRYYERLDAATLQLAAAGYDESVVDLVNHPYYGATLQPFDIPEMPDEVRLYLAWQEQQPKGADTSVEAYVRFLESFALRPAA